MRKLTVVLLSTIGMAICQEPSAHGPLTFTFVSIEPSYKLGVPVLVQVVITNTSSRTVMWLRHRSESEFDVWLKDAAGRPVELTESHRRVTEQGVHSSPRYTKLAAGQVVKSEIIDLSKYFRFSSPGVYTAGLSQRYAVWYDEEKRLVGYTGKASQATIAITPPDKQ